MSKPQFSYVTYINAPAEKVWQALTTPEFTERYWSGRRVESDWRVGSPIRFVTHDDRLSDSGEILEAEPPRRLSFTWRVEFAEEFRREGYSRVTFELEPDRGVTKLTLNHDRFEPGSRVLEAISDGWPSLLANLKTLLETGEPMPNTGPEAAEEAEKEAVAQAKRNAGSAEQRAG
jgi:uncharacterized protein YndB with AHSA1/START domain